MNWEALKNNKAVKWGLIIGLPTVLVGAYFGIKYIQEKNYENTPLKLNPDGSVDTTGMGYYRITAPFTPDVTSKIFKAISKIKYANFSEKVIKDDSGNDIVAMELMTNDEGVVRFKRAISKLGKGFVFTKTSKDQLLTVPKKLVCTKKDDSINNINDFYEVIKCLAWKDMFGYDLTVIKDLSNIEKRLTVDELRQIADYAKLGMNKMDKIQEDDFIRLMKKAYTPI